MLRRSPLRADRASMMPSEGHVHASNERASGLAFAQYLVHYTTEAYHTYCDSQGLSGPTTMQKAVALAHLRVAYEPDDDDDEVVVSPAPEEARSARLFVRELLARWGLAGLADDAELIITELVVNAVRHGLRAAPAVASAGVSPQGRPLMRLCVLRRVGEVMLAVTDPSIEPPVPKTPDSSRECGRGLQIVGAVSYVWGWSPIEGYGKAVWAVLKHP